MNVYICFLSNNNGLCSEIFVYIGILLYGSRFFEDFSLARVLRSVALKRGSLCKKPFALLAEIPWQNLPDTVQSVEKQRFYPRQLWLAQQ